MLVGNDFFKPMDAVKIFAVSGVSPGLAGVSNATIALTNCAFKIYKVKDADSSSTLFATTKNYDYDAALTTNIPFKDVGFIAFRKGGDGAVYKKTQARETNILGARPTDTVPLP